MNEQMTINPLLAKIKLPGKIFQLPSRGLLYSNGELDPSIKDAEVQVLPLSAFDEIMLKNPDMLFSGKAIEEVFSRCVPDVKKPLDLMGKDIDALILYLRLVTYGSQYEMRATHTCKDANPHRYTVDLETLLPSIKFIDPTMLTEIYTVILENGQVVKLQPIRYRHIIDLFQANDGKKKLSADDIKNNLIINLSNTIKSIDDIEDKELIGQWMKVAPAPYIQAIADKIEKTNDWGINLNYIIKCKDCETNYEIELPINPISFFS
jgi:hypothetical protein